jgi:hypothetical protein
MHCREKFALYVPISRFRDIWRRFAEKQKYSIWNKDSNTFFKFKIIVKMALQWLL